MDDTSPEPHTTSTRGVQRTRTRHSSQTNGITGHNISRVSIDIGTPDQDYAIAVKDAIEFDAVPRWWKVASYIMNLLTVEMCLKRRCMTCEDGLWRGVELEPH